MTGKQITQLRERLDLSRADLAGLLRVTQLTVVRWESGSNSPVGLSFFVLRMMHEMVSGGLQRELSRVLHDYTTGRNGYVQTLAKFFALAEKRHGTA